MFQVIGDSINNLYEIGMCVLASHGSLEQSRNGEVLVTSSPVTTTWYYPDKRVLVNMMRNCNHAFHLNEAIWMLKGERYAQPLDTFIHDFSSRYAEKDGHMHGAYGDRWRNHFVMDQITEIIQILFRDPTSRQAVMGMWDPQTDLVANVKDKPCNTHLYFRVNKGALDMTVCNRSNDIIWGLYGANAVHFSILQEFMAASLGLHLGSMHTISNNFHAYKNIFQQLWGTSVATCYNYAEGIPLIDMVESPGLFMQDVMAWDYGITHNGFKTKWFNKVAIPVTKAFLHKKWKNYADMESWLHRIEDENWFIGMRNWCHQEEIKDGRRNKVELQGHDSTVRSGDSPSEAAGERSQDNPGQGEN